MKISEANYISLIEELIYFDEEWKFPEYNIKEYLESDGTKLPNNFFEISIKIVEQLNKNKVNTKNFKNEFYKIIKL